MLVSTMSDGKMEREVRLPEPGRGLQPELVARRALDRLRRPRRRPHRPLRLRPRARLAAPADQRCLCRSAAGLVARRHHPRLLDRPLRHRPGAAHGSRPPGSRCSTSPPAASARCPASRAAKHLNPQWAPDGAEPLLPRPTRIGITNVYRYELADGPITQLTDLFTGVSGITEDSPALSVAQGTGRVVFSVFRTDGYEIHAIDPARRWRAGRWSNRCRAGPACYHRRSAASLLASQLEDPGSACRRSGVRPADYRAGLSLTTSASRRSRAGQTSSAPTSAAGPRCTSRTCWGTATWSPPFRSTAA